MRYSNLHTHTVFSDGAHSVEENILSAIEKNMESIGFSDHSHTFCDTSYCMKEDCYSNYIKTVNALKEKYSDKIKVFLGIEKDYYSEINNEDYDYIISSVHYIIKDDIVYPIDHSGKQQMDCIEDAFGGDVIKMAEHYYNMVVENIKKSKPDIIGHFDVISKFSIMPEDDQRYRNVAIDALKRSLSLCNYIEVNTGAISRGWRKEPYPHRFLLEEILKLGGEVVLGSDSHNKNNLDFYFNESVELLKEVGFDHISVFIGDGFKKVNI